jgi:ankyrin repeat protein
MCHKSSVVGPLIDDFTLTGRRHLPVMQLLIRCRADVGVTDAAKQTALHLAAKAGREKQVRELIVHGKARMNQRDVCGQTALHLAAVHDVTGMTKSDVVCFCYKFTSPLMQ